MIILTSNLGTEFLSNSEEGDQKPARAQAMAAVQGHFRPEFLNRLDEIILFHRLARANMDKIVQVQMGRPTFWPTARSRSRWTTRRRPGWQMPVMIRSMARGR